MNIHKLYNWYLHSQRRIKLENFINYYINKIVNNRVSNWLKEFFNIGFDYPLYMYSKVETEDGGYKDIYVHSLLDGVLPDGKSYSDISITDSVEHAMNFRNVLKITRYFLLKKANKILEENGQNIVLKYKGYMSIEAKIDTDPNMILGG